MQIKNLHLRRYGHFDDRTVEFAASGLTIVYGPNETGKSTSLSAIADLLYGFGHTTQYDFRFDAKQLRIGAKLVNRADQDLSIFRRKGNKDTLLDQDEKAIPDAALIPYLGRSTRDFFEKAFGLSHERLREGGDAIAHAEGDLGQILFEAGSGLRGLAEMQQELEKEADIIFGARKSNRVLYLTADAHDQASRELKQAVLKRQEWIDADADLRSAREALEAARETLRGLQNEQAKLNRWERVLPILHELDTCRSALADLGPDARLPVDARERFISAVTQRTIGMDSVAGAQEGLAQANRLIEECPVDESLQCAFESVSALFQRASGIEEQLANLPILESQIELTLGQILAQARELALPIANDRPTVPRNADLVNLSDLVALKQQLDDSLQKAVAEELDISSTVERLERELATIGNATDPKADLAVVQKLLTKYAALGDDRALERSVKRAESRLENLRAGFPWWNGSFEELLSNREFYIAGKTRACS